jgi:[glutamine synthetase] adenylyltransferase / [glutamine synthetase]-adenylyl-L-tyrosine phosphorylase
MALPRSPLTDRQGELPELSEARTHVEALLCERGLPAGEDTCTLGALLSVAYPALRRSIEARPEDLVYVVHSSLKVRRNPEVYERIVREACPDLSDLEGVRRGLRLVARREKLRIAARELFPTLGDVDIAARELSDLADQVVRAALAEAALWATERFGKPLTLQGTPCGFTVLGMGKLGGQELNAGSDIDLLPFYETDEGELVKDGCPTDVSLHEYFTRVTQRFTATLDDATAEGIVWRVDLRLRPEGSRGPLVNALGAAERYYENWGRTWERAALLRARPMAGDPEFGARVLAALTPFVWRRVVKPEIAAEMAELVVRARAELSQDAERDLKHGVGGIREAEFFVQSLQLIWGGKDLQLRAPGTLDALLRLRSRGLVTEREARDVRDGYLALRRIEHRIQNATGLHTHELPREPTLGAIATSLGFASVEGFLGDLAAVRGRVAARLASIVVSGTSDETPTEILRLFVALDSGEEERVRDALPSSFGRAPDLPRHLLTLAKRPDDPLGAKTRDVFPVMARETVRALAEAGDPEQASRLLCAFFLRLRTPGVYVRALAEDLRVLYRLVGLFGASAFLGGALTGHPELVDRLLFARGAPNPETARAAVAEELATPHELDDDPADALVGALRRAKGRVTMEVGLAELSGELGSRDAQRVLTALAEETLARALRTALDERGLEGGLVVVGMGKLGGCEIGYGSDLDIFFVYRDTDDDDAAEKYVRTAQRVLRLVSVPHGDGPGYELDTRLRPSGSQGLLVVSLEAFRKYHADRSGRDPEAADWERQALLRARLVAGDEALGAEVMAVATQAAYERGAPSAAKMHELRLRMERELGRERRGDGRARIDLKVGYGGLVDVEFAVQYLQMANGHDKEVRTPETEAALVALEARGVIDAHDAAVLGDGYRGLRRLEQALRISTGTGATVLEEGKPSMPLLARRLGMRDGPNGSAAHALFAHVHSLTKDVRSAYLEVLGRDLPLSHVDGRPSGPIL